MLRRTIAKLNVGEDQIRTIVKIEGSECQSNTLDAFKNLISLMQEIHDLPHLLQGEAFAPSEVTFRHNGTRWIIESSGLSNRVENGITTVSAVLSSTSKGGS